MWTAGGAAADAIAANANGIAKAILVLACRFPRIRSV